jgi:hypothetical protein
MVVFSVLTCFLGRSGEEGGRRERRGGKEYEKRTNLFPVALRNPGWILIKVNNPQLLWLPCCFSIFPSGNTLLHFFLGKERALI